jgi:TonB family protein
MSTNPPQKVQDEALDLPLEERVRLAYKLLESLDKSLEKGGIKDSPTAPPAPTPSTPETTAFRDDELQTGRAAAPPAPKAPEPVAAPAPEPPAPPPTYKIRFDDGSGVSIPVKLSVTPSRRPPAPTKSQPPVEATPPAAAPVAEAPTPVLDEPSQPAAATPLAAAPATPLAAKPHAIATSADLPAPEEVAAMLDRLVPLNPAPAPQPPAPRVQRAQTQPHQAQPLHAVPPQQPAAAQSHPAPAHAQPVPEATVASGAHGKAIDLAPEPVAASALVKAPGTAPDPFIDWELIPTGDGGNTELATQAPVRGVGLTFSAWKRTGVVATTVVGGVGAMAALVFALQGPEASATDFTPAPAVVSAPATVSPPVTVAPPPVEPTPEPRAQPRGQEEEEPARAAETDRTPTVETPLAPTFSIPTIPTLSESAIATGANAPPTVGAPVIRLPTTGSTAPAGPATSNQRLQLPQVRNASRVQQALERAYPIGLREVGIGGRVELAFYINEQGAVEQFEVRQSSGNSALDQAALRVAPEFQFTPAQRGNSPVAGWFARGITFGNVVSAGVIAEVAPPDVAPTGTGPQPVATQFDQAPQVRNTAQVRQALDREYPIGLRATGTGGRVEIWFYVNDRGVVERSQLRRSSGNQDLDRAALKVAQVFQFNPGLRGGSPVTGWISVPIVFDGAAPGPDSPDPVSDPNAVFLQPS